MALFGGEEGFPRKVKYATRTTELGAQHTTTAFRFDALPPGTYAIVVLHDENGDHELNTNFFGIPLEQYGFTNNAESTFGPPSFKDAQVKVTTGATRVEIRLHK